MPDAWCLLPIAYCLMPDVAGRETRPLRAGGVPDAYCLLPDQLPGICFIFFEKILDNQE